MVSAHEELAGKIFRISMLWHYRFNTLECEYVIKLSLTVFPPPVPASAGSMLEMEGVSPLLYVTAPVFVRLVLNLRT